MREFITQFDSTYFSAMKTRMDSINTSLETLINNSNNSNTTVDTNTNKELTELVKVYSDTQNTQLNTILEKFNIVESNLTNINETLNIKIANNTSDPNLKLFDTSILNNIDNNIQTFVTDFNKWTVTNGNTLANILNIIDNYAQTEIDKLTENNYLTSQIFNTVDSTAQSVIEILTEQYINITSKLNFSQPTQNIINDTNLTDEEQIITFLETQFDKLFQSLNTITPDENEKFNQTINNYINYNTKKTSNTINKNSEIPQISTETISELLAPYKKITDNTNNTNNIDNNKQNALSMSFKGIIKNISLNTSKDTEKNINDNPTLVNNKQIINNRKNITVNKKQKTENANIKKTKPKNIADNNYTDLDISHTFNDLIKLTDEKNTINSNLTKQTRKQIKLTSNEKPANATLEKTNNSHKEIVAILKELSTQRMLVNQLLLIKQKELNMMIRANEIAGRLLQSVWIDSLNQ